MFHSDYFSTCDYNLSDTSLNIHDKHKDILLNYAYTHIHVRFVLNALDLAST